VIITANIRSDQLRDFELRVWLEFEKSSETVKKCINCKGANADGINGILRCESHGTAYYFIWNRHFAAVNLASMTTSGRFDETFKEHANFTFKCLSSHVDTKTRGQLKFIIALVDLR
jgi:hypothetical protein